MITALAGGIGAARFLQGLTTLIPSKELTIVVNTGDDIELFGLDISPDIDIIIYTLAGVVDEQKGWGFKEDSFNCLGVLQKLGFETWFKLGDKDLATHIRRTHLLKNGFGLSAVTNRICRAFGLGVKILPMTEDKFRTVIVTDKGRMHFQEYLIKRGAQDRVLGVEFDDAETARATPGVIESILDSDAVIVCPSNPIVSIGTILSINGVTDALMKTRARIVAVSPIVGSAPIKGPADKLMRGLGLEVSAFGVAGYYRAFLDTLVIDSVDKAQEKRIRDLGLKVVITNTIMRTLQDKAQLARFVLDQAMA